MGLNNRRIRNSLLLFLLCAPLAAQDCSFGANFTTTGTSPPYYNLASGGCVFWNVTATVTGFSGFSVTFQGAADSGGTPGSFSTVGGVTAGANPIIANNTTLSTDEYHDWLRMDLTSATGTGNIVINAYGYRQGSGTAAGSAGSIQLTNGSGVFQAASGFAGTFSVVGYPQDDTGGGLNDLTSGGTFTDWMANAGTTFTITISSTGTPDHFTWEKNSGPVSSPVAITGSAQPLSDGVTATFAATTGHTLNYMWIIPIEDHIKLPNQSSPCGAGCANVFLDSGTNTTSVLDSSNNTILIGAIASPSISQWLGDGMSNVGVGYNVFGGYQPGCKFSVAVGESAGRVCASSANVFLGYVTGYNVTTGSANTYLGERVASQNTSTGSQNTGVGQNALSKIAAGGNNTGIGQLALSGVTSGSGNTGLGLGAGASVSSGSSDVFIGLNAGGSETGSNKLYIDVSNTATPLIGGDFSARTVTINGTHAATSYQSTGYAFASLPSATNGTIVYCQDCDAGILGGACTSVGAKTGNIAVRLNGAWRCLD